MDKITGNPDQRVNLALTRYQIKTGREILQAGIENLSAARAELAACQKINGNAAKDLQTLMTEARQHIQNSFICLNAVCRVLEKAQDE